MVTSTLPPGEIRRLRDEYEGHLVLRPGEEMPGIVYFEPPKVRQREPPILGVPLKMVEATINRVWRNGGPPIEIMEFDEHHWPDHPRVAFIKTKTAGDKVLKVEGGTGQEGMLNEGVAQRLLREVGLNSVKIGVDGLESRG